MSVRNRIQQEVRKIRDKSDRIDVRPRNSDLLSIEGWYRTKTYVPPLYADLYDEYLRTNSTLKFTRWLIRNNKISADYVTKTGSILDPFDLKLSCRYNDLLRLADTNHYMSCFQNWRGSQQLRYLADPDIAIVYVPDSAGKYVWRSLIRLMTLSGEKVLMTHRVYTDNPQLDNAVFKRLDNIYPLYIASNGYSTNRKILVSITKHNNKVVGNHVWSDHFCKLNDDMHLVMFGTRFEIS